MTLDLELITAGWERPPSGAITARLLDGVNGEELIQLRVDLGVLQMFTDGRPDGLHYRGQPSAFDYVLREQRGKSAISPEVWQETERELQQYNYRRMAFMGLADEVLGHDDLIGGEQHLRRAVRDIDQCLYILRMIEDRQGGVGSAFGTLAASLVYNRAKAVAKLRVAQQRFEEAVEALESGMLTLEDVLSRLGLDEDSRRHDAGLAYLRQAARSLRQKHGIRQTLRERLAQAIANEDFELAARLRDELRIRELGADPCAAPSRKSKDSA